MIRSKDLPRVAKYDREADVHEFSVFMREGGWCWFQGARAVVSDQHLVMGSIRGNGNGEALIGAYDLDAQSIIGQVTVHPSFEFDDHNSPVFFRRSDGSLLTVYARHGSDKHHHSRISSPGNPLAWGEEMIHQRSSPFEVDTVTYMNLLQPGGKGALYNFYRHIDYCPTVVTSEDEGLTWGEPVQLIDSGLEKRHRPYACYADDGASTIHIIFTDAHPRRFGNSIYHVALREGVFYRADGTAIQALADGPVTPAQCDQIYRGSMNFDRPEGTDSVPGAAWASSIMVDAQGYPHLAYSVHHSISDHRYRIASWTGSEWIDREVAFAGNGLYQRESSYTGLITIDPRDPTYVLISTDVHPQTATPLGQYEIFRGSVGLDNARETITWQAVTSDSPVHNIRPLILRAGGRRIVLWQRGNFVTFRDYQLDTIGLIEETDL